MTTLRNRLSASKISSISADDIKKYGVEGGTYLDKDFDHRFLLVKIPAVSTINKEGKTVKGKAQMAYYDVATGEMGVGLASDFFALLPETLPTLAKVAKWKERENNLSEEERTLLLAAIDHEARILGRRYSQEEKEQALGFLIKNESVLQKVIREERKYQSLSRTERALWNRTEKARVAERRREARRLKTRNYIIEKKNIRRPQAWREEFQKN